MVLPPLLCVAPVICASIKNNGIAYAVVLDSKSEHPLQVWHEGKKVAESLRSSYRPWALEIADVDGDDVDEIAVGLTKSTKYLPFPHRTLFIMRFNGKQIVRKWAGSTMGRPLLEFCFGPKVKGRPQTLFTLETRIDGSTALSANRWTGFGFAKTGHEMSWRRASGLTLAGERLILQANSKATSIPIRDLQ